LRGAWRSLARHDFLLALANYLIWEDVLAAARLVVWVANFVSSAELDTSRFVREPHYSFKNSNNKQPAKFRWDAQRHKDMLRH
jgi:hypothetical protein